MPNETDYAGVAALSICEALLLALSDHAVLPQREIQGLLHDAAASHENAIGLDAKDEMHGAVVLLINQIIAGGSSARQR